MQSVNVNEFYTANISFNIQDADLALINAAPLHTPIVVDENDEDAEWLASPNNPDNMTIESIQASSGELEGYTEVGEGYFADDRVEVEHTPLCDTTTLSDDFLKVADTDVVDAETGLTKYELIQQARTIYQYTGVWVPVVEADIEWVRVENAVEGRWAHMADADTAELEGLRKLYTKLDTTKRPFGEMAMLSKWRKERYFNMVCFIDTCNDVDKLRRMQQAMWKRYINSVKSCAISGEWFALYLTKRDAREISTLITDKRNTLLGRASTEYRTIVAK
jgi:hypothetical protein